MIWTPAIVIVSGMFFLVGLMLVMFGVGERNKVLKILGLFLCFIPFVRTLIWYLGS